MKKAATLTLLLIILQASLARAALVNLRVNAPVPSSASVPAQSLVTQTYTDTQINTCIEKTCGPAVSNIGAYNAFSKKFLESPQFQKVWIDLESKIKDRLENEAKQGAKLMERLQTFYKERPQIKIRPEAHAFLAWSKIHTIVDDRTAELRTFDAKTNTMTFNEEKYLEITEGLPETTRVALRAYVNQWWGLALNKPLPATKFENLLNVKLRAYYPGIPIREALKRYAQQQLSRLNQLKQTLPILSAFVGEDFESILTQASNGTDLGKEDSQVIEGPTLIIDMLTEITRGDLFQALLAVPIDTHLIFTPEVQNRILGTTKQDTGENSDAMAKITEVCKPKLAQLMQASVNDEQMKRFKPMLSEVQSAAKRVAARLVAPSEVETINGVIDAARFDYSDSAAEELVRFKSSLRKTSSYRAFLGTDAAASEAITVFLMIMGTNPNSSKGDSAAEEICGKISASTISDYALSALGQIEVSWFTLVHPDVGIGILAHELGHVTSFKLREIARRNKNSALGFLSSFDCVANRNPFVLNPLSLGVENTIWSEEDWADHFSSLVLNELQASDSIWMKNNRNKACALVTNFDFYFGNSIQPAAGDPHSSGFLRMLMIGNDRGKLDPVCKPFLNYADTNSRKLICN